MQPNRKEEKGIGSIVKKSEQAVLQRWPVSKDLKEVREQLCGNLEAVTSTRAQSGNFKELQKASEATMVWEETGGRDYGACGAEPCRPL